MASRRHLHVRPASIVFAVVVILSLSATAALADLPANRPFQSPIPPLTNDNFADATDLDVTALPVTVQVDNSSATFEWGVENQNCSVDRTVWYRFVAPASTTYKLDMLGSAAPEPVVVLYRDYGGGLAGLNYVGCAEYGNHIPFTTQAGEVYYLQAGNKAWVGGGGVLKINLSMVMPPPNDNFAGAEVIEALPRSDIQQFEGATLEPNEPLPNCTGTNPGRSVWYSYTPAADRSVTAAVSAGFYPVMAIYTGSDLTGLTQVACTSGSGSRVTIAVQAGTTYYFQVTNLWSSEYGEASFQLIETPPPTADFSWYPWDPSRYDRVNFCDYSNDPYYTGWSEYWWDFGGGAVSSGLVSCANHQFAADGDYTVWHKIQTVDGREAEVTRTVQVRTHDVAITKFSVPKSASAGQTRQIVVGLRNYEYTEEVMVELEKSVVGGFEWVGASQQQVAVRSGNRTTDFNFNYTFTSDDAALGKVTFRATAVPINVREALTADNEAISLPCKVSRR